MAFSPHSAAVIGIQIEITSRCRRTALVSGPNKPFVVRSAGWEGTDECSSPDGHGRTNVALLTGNYPVARSVDLAPVTCGNVTCLRCRSDHVDAVGWRTI